MNKITAAAGDSCQNRHFNFIIPPFYTSTAFINDFVIAYGKFIAKMWVESVPNWPELCQIARSCLQLVLEYRSVAVGGYFENDYLV